MKNVIEWSYIGRTGYEEAYNIQNTLRDKIIREMTSLMGYILFLEHNPVITVGKFGNNDNLLISEKSLLSRGIEFYKTNRGGDYTYHGPGQLVCYPVLDLRKIGIGVKKYVNILEKVIIDTLNGFNISAERKKSYPGVWVETKKIAFIGINLKRHVTMHGFSLNLDVNSDYYSYINPCGITGLEIISVSDLYHEDLDIEKIIGSIVRRFSTELSCEFIKSNNIVNE